MKIKYLSSQRLYYGFLAGCQAVIRQQHYLNSINVFPIPDADTGTNLASTMRSISEGIRLYPSVKDTFRSISDAALLGARGNSGVILSQYMYGISSELSHTSRIASPAFSQILNEAVQYAYDSLLEPVEGTILTVIREWAAFLSNRSHTSHDLFDLLGHSLHAARHALHATPQQLDVLAKAGVVDAGASGFVSFVEGIVEFMSTGRLRELANAGIQWEEAELAVHQTPDEITQRYCTEALVEACRLDSQTFRQALRDFGDSLIVAGSPERTRIHIHTNRPADVFSLVNEHGVITQIKADDMLRQYQISHQKKHPIALVTDSSCDLPETLLDRYQIQVIPFMISFGASVFLDKITMTPAQFYEMLQTHPQHPKSAQPNFRAIQNIYTFLASHYQQIIAVHISEKLSGVYQQSLMAAKHLQHADIKVINSRHLSVSLGLLVLRIAEAIDAGWAYDTIVQHIDDWIANTRIYVDIDTLKYMVRGGRVSPLKGGLAKMFNLKPLVSLDAQGKGCVLETSFSRRKSMTKLLERFRRLNDSAFIWKYALVHSQARPRAEQYAERLTSIFGCDPAYIMDVSPVVGVHNGIGTVGIAVMKE